MDDKEIETKFADWLRGYDSDRDGTPESGARHLLRFARELLASRPCGELVTRVPTVEDYHDSDWNPDETEAFGKAVWADREDEVTMADIAHAEGFYFGWKTALQLPAPVAEVPSESELETVAWKAIPAGPTTAQLIVPLIVKAIHAHLLTHTRPDVEKDKHDEF